MTLKFDAISALGTRDVVVSLAGYMEDAEVISTVSVVSFNAAILQIVGTPIKNAVAIDQDGITAAIGKAVEFSIAGLQADINIPGSVKISFTGTSGSAECVTVMVPIIPCQTT